MVVVLESAAVAAERGARPLCRLLAHGAAFDPTAQAHDWGRGEMALGRSLRRFLDRSGLAPAGDRPRRLRRLGSRSGDRLEALTLGPPGARSRCRRSSLRKARRASTAAASSPPALLAAGGERAGPDRRLRRNRPRARPDALDRRRRTARPAGQPPHRSRLRRRRRLGARRSRLGARSARGIGRIMQVLCWKTASTGLPIGWRHGYGSPPRRCRCALPCIPAWR